MRVVTGWLLRMKMLSDIDEMPAQNTGSQNRKRVVSLCFGVEADLFGFEERLAVDGGRDGYFQR